MVKKNIRKIINLYKKDLEKKIKVSSMVLFGSQVSGKKQMDSDIDLLVISQNFKRMNPDKRLELLYKERKNPITFKYSMDIFGVTPEEYENASDLTILGEIKETGIKVV